MIATRSARSVSKPLERFRRKPCMSEPQQTSCSARRRTERNGLLGERVRRWCCAADTHMFCHTSHLLHEHRLPQNLWRLCTCAALAARSHKMRTAWRLGAKATLMYQAYYGGLARYEEELQMAKNKLHFRSAPPRYVPRALHAQEDLQRGCRGTARDRAQNRSRLGSLPLATRQAHLQSLDIPRFLSC